MYRLWGRLFSAERAAGETATSTQKKAIPLQCVWEGLHHSHNLTKHKLLHSQAKPFLCTHCGKSFNLNDKMLRHLRTVHDESMFPWMWCSGRASSPNPALCHVLTFISFVLYLFSTVRGHQLGGQSVCFSMIWGFVCFGLVWFSIRGRCH
jgi:hypothetical protein